MSKMSIIFLVVLLFCNFNAFGKLKRIIPQDMIKHEKENPVFAQKGGMLRVGEHSFYLRTNDEWTGFSTIIIGYRYGVSKAFNIALEGGVSPIPYVFLGALVLHFKLFETKNKLFFLGMRMRFGYKYQEHTDAMWESILNVKNYLGVKRNGLYFAADLTAAFRFGKMNQYCFYYSIYPRFDFDFFDKEYPIYILFSPVMIGFEIRYGRQMRWSFAIESGYTFPIPWNGVPAGKWVNFPSLANVSFNYRFGDKFYKDKSMRITFKKVE